MKALLCVVLLFLVLAPAAAQQPARPDISGGAAFIFKRPKNPEASTQQRSGDDNGDKVEDAISLGNTARDRTPPDLESAEKAYRLAWKLNPRDPRPYVGIGNVYWDRRRYAEAATWYRDAIRSIERPKIAGMVGGIASGGGDKISFGELRAAHQAEGYLAATFLQEQRFMLGERDLKSALLSDSRNAEWHAMLGYALTSQGRYTEAAESYEKAVRFEPGNEKFKELLQQTTLKARAASANDQTIAAQLADTSWTTRSGTCQLMAQGIVRCTNSDDTFGKGDANWKVADGLFELRRVLIAVPLCVGQFRDKAIEMKCGVKDFERSQRWTKN